MRITFVSFVLLLLTGCADPPQATSIPAVLFDPPTECTISMTDEAVLEACVDQKRLDHESGSLSGGELIQHCGACCFGNPDEDACIGACVNAEGNLPSIGCEVPPPPPFDESSARAECTAQSQVDVLVSPNCGSCDVVSSHMICTPPDGGTGVRDRCELRSEYEAMGWSCGACERELGTYRQCSCPDGSATWQSACSGPRNQIELTLN